MWWFYTHCQVVDDDVADVPSDPPLLPVQTFTPLLGSLLLSQNGLVSQTARLGVVDLLGRLKSSAEDSPMFGPHERKLLEQEILLGVVVGMARLDFPDDVLEYPEHQNGHSDSAVQYQPHTHLIEPEYSNGIQPALHLESQNQQKLQDDSMTRESPDKPDPEKSLPRFQASPSPDPPPEPPSPFLSDSDVFQDPDNSDPFGSWVPPSPNPGSEPTFGSRYHEDEDGWLRAEAGASGFDDSGEEATVGRVASMSLIAAVTANGLLDDEGQKIFVHEVERVGRDPVHWVRREAGFALGALAKVVPLEVVLSTLVPLFESFVHDTVWHVRTSVLYALPPILSRLAAPHRRSLALNTLTLLARDASQSVRSALLEVLGETIHEFRNDPEGPPIELIRLFIGWDARRSYGDHNEPWLTDSQSGSGKTLDTISEPDDYGSGSEGSLMSMFASSSSLVMSNSHGNYFRDPERALICAFNYPAVTLTLGPERWGELREYYQHLAQDRAPKVRRTLAASLGVIAKIIGPDNARRDLVDVWWDAIRSEEPNVRTKAVECLVEFMEALGPGERDEIERALEQIWTDDIKGWRERETLAGLLAGLARCLNQNGTVARGLLMKALRDEVAAVREAAIAIVPAMSKVYEGKPEVLRDLRRDLDSLASADSYRKRATFIACSLAILNDEQLGTMEVKRAGLWDILGVLQSDRIVDVRIGVSRSVGVICEKFYPDSHTRPQHVSGLVQQLAHDPSLEVRSYVVFLLSPGSPQTTTPVHTPNTSRFATFSKPPHIIPHQPSFLNQRSPFVNRDDQLLVNRTSINRTGESSFIDHDDDSDEDLEGEIDLDDVDESDEDQTPDVFVDENQKGSVDPAQVPIPPSPSEEHFQPYPIPPSPSEEHSPPYIITSATESMESEPHPESSSSESFLLSPTSLPADARRTPDDSPTLATPPPDGQTLPHNGSNSEHHGFPSSIVTDEDHYSVGNLDQGIPSTLLEDQPEEDDDPFMKFVSQRKTLQCEKAIVA